MRLSDRRGVWGGLRLEHARWRAEAGGAEGLILLPDHLLFVTLSGSTGTTSAVLDGGRPYRGADFPGAVSFVPARQRRRAWHRGGHIEYLTVRLDPGHAALAGAPDVEFRGFTNRPDPFVHQVARSLCGELASGGPGGELFVDSLTTALALHLLRRYSSLAPGTETARAVLSGRRLAAVMDCIRDELGTELRLDRLAEVAGLGRARFCREFRAATGRSPHQYVLERRVARAAELLAGSARPIADIAHAVGFSSQSHLTTAFRRINGTTPLAYRRSGPGARS